jgi:hypothetical protein
MLVETHTRRASVPSGTECEMPGYLRLFFSGMIADSHITFYLLLPPVISLFDKPKDYWGLAMTGRWSIVIAILPNVIASLSEAISFIRCYKVKTFVKNRIASYLAMTSRKTKSILDF